MYPFANDREVHAMPVSTPSGLGPAVERAYAEALDEWLQTNRRGRDNDVAISTDLKRAAITVDLAPQRVSRVYIEITGRRPWQCGVYGFRIAYQADRSWKVTRR